MIGRPMGRPITADPTELEMSQAIGRALNRPSAAVQDVGVEVGLAIPARRAACDTAFWITVSWRWWRCRTPLRRSV